MTVIVTHVCPPIPVRQFDWSAHFDGEEEGPVGWGESYAAAIMALMNNLENNDD